MLTGIREKAIVKENGIVQISAPDLEVGTEVEVLVLVEEKEMDATDYLLSTEANRKNLEQALEELKHPENFVRIDLDELEKQWKE
ncbi:MAG: hypothetical protein ACR2HG_02525 [Pyrinomonadaceae bacterium]